VPVNSQNLLINPPLIKHYLCYYDITFWLQIFPVNIKGQAGSLATLTNWFGAWLCSYTFNFLMSWSSYGNKYKSLILVLFHSKA